MAHYIDLPTHLRNVVFPEYTMPSAGVWRMSGLYAVDTGVGDANIVGGGQLDALQFRDNGLFGMRINAASKTIGIAASLDGVNAFSTSQPDLFPVNGQIFAMGLEVNLDTGAFNLLLGNTLADLASVRSSTIDPTVLRGRVFPFSTVVMGFSQESGARLYALNINDEHSYDANSFDSSTTNLPDLIGSADGTVGNIDQFIFYDETVDTILPVITLLGSASITQAEGGSYTDAGATALDNVDGDLTASIVVGGDTVNPNAPATYTITYNVVDAAGNAANQVTRDVIIQSSVDSVLPVITLLGSSTVNITVGDTYVDAGATATDNVDGTITANIVTVNPVDDDTVGNYTITYNVVDSANNAAIQVTRLVSVQAVVVEGTLIAISGIPNGPQNLFLINPISKIIAYDADATFLDGETTVVLNATSGDILKGYVDDGTTADPVGGRVLVVA